MKSKDKKKPVITGEKLDIRDSKGRFVEGAKGNPNGRPPGTGYIKLLEEAISEVEKEKQKSFFKRVIERAYISDSVLVAVLKKFIPDRQYTQIQEVEDMDIAKAKESFKKKLDHITQRYEEVEAIKQNNKDEPVEASKEIGSPKVRIKKNLSMAVKKELEEPDTNKGITISKGIGYGKYDKVIIKDNR